MIIGICRKKTLSKTLNEVIKLLEGTDNTEWIGTFKYFYQSSISVTANAEMRDLIREIRKIFAGMGSFSDVVLYSDGEVLVDKNVHLDKLKDRLFGIVNKR